jgi:hypothetical protein
VEVAWHAVRDCLRVLYDNAISDPEAPPEHVSRYSKEGEKYHTGLSVDQLADPRIVSEAYGLHLKATAELCLRLSAKATSSFKASKPGH